MYPRSEILFPHRCIKGLRNLLDTRWANVIDSILDADQASPDSLAFSLAMIKLCGCMSCDMGSYKASLGCDVCAQRAVLGMKGNSTPLISRYKVAIEEIAGYLERGEIDLSDDIYDLGSCDQEGEITISR